MDASPSFVGPFSSVWPWATPLPGARLVATRFDPALFFEQGDDGCHGITLPPRLRSAVAKRQAEFIAGRLCARRSLHLLDGRNEVPGMHEDRSPHWPDGYVGSITHSDGWAAAVVAHRQVFMGIGLDAERLLDEGQALRLVRKVLTPHEAKRLEPSDIRLIVSATFSLKESLFKALYPMVGRMFHFQAAELVAWNGIGPVRLRLLTDLGNGWSAGREVAGEICVFEGRLLSLVAVPAQHCDTD
ncbi:MAG: 4'-phosphopantetheinyl transferase superfamily protein [Halomonas sp.]|nr:4'-phosphopantetheinyl transferase superfamily protein [Halomonas sp.]MCC5883303.1 4'-phosphopantetheinyl transferase superfamily protein [Halomonas sp.]